MIQKLEMTVLIDYLAEAPLVGEWGLSIFFHRVMLCAPFVSLRY